MQTVPLPQPIDEPRSSPTVGTAGRVLGILVGLTTGAAMLVVGGVYALMSTCDYDGSATCSGLVDTLDLVVVFAGTCAAIAGAIGTAITGEPRWITIGLTATIVLALLLALLVALQQPVTWS